MKPKLHSVETMHDSSQKPRVKIKRKASDNERYESYTKTSPKVSRILKKTKNKFISYTMTMKISGIRDIETRN